MVDSLNTLVQGIANKLLGINHAMLLKRVQKDGFLQCDMCMMFIVGVIVEDSRCHNHIPNSCGGATWDRRRRRIGEGDR